MTPMLLLDYLVQKFPDSTRTTLKKMVEARRVTVNGRPAYKLKQEVTPADKIEIRDKPKAKAPSDSRKPAGRGGVVALTILHEDEDVIVLIKPAGLLTSTNERERRPTVAAKLTVYLEDTSPESRIGIVHRLDRDASGLIVFSKNAKAYHYLKHQFYHHTVERLYTAVVEGLPAPKVGKIENLLFELPTGQVVQISDKSKGQIAITEYEVLATLDIPKSRRRQPPIELPLHDTPAQPWACRSLLRVKLETGRKHQIRAHFAARKTPIVGDPMYGPDPEPVSPLLLAATSLAFDHPTTGERMKFVIDPPKEILAIFPDAAKGAEGEDATPAAEGE
jgi:23S rRNA pseudouridine1911/1915/1917 synthase